VSEKVAAVKPSFSFSRLAMFSRCGEQYRRRYVENLIIPPSVAQHVGSSVHSSAEHNYRQKKATHKDMPVADIRELAIETFKAGVLSGMVFSREEELIGKGKIINTAEKKVLATAELYGREVAPAIQPVEVERLFELDLGFALLTFKPDLISSEERIHDTKVTNRPIDVARDLQTTLYSSGHNLVFGHWPAGGVCINQLKDLKSGPEHIPHLATKGPADEVVLFARLNAMFAAINAGVFLPCSADSWYCCARWCGYFNSCKFAARSNQ